MAIPGKEECCYVLEMIESNLIDFSYTHPWAEQVISTLDHVSSWLGDLATKKYKGDQSRALREYIFSEPFEPCPDEMEKFHIACLWLRYERRVLSWATFLRLAGERLDTANADWDCETPFHYLNVFEYAYFSRESEEQTKEDYIADHNLRPWIEMAEKRFEPFKKVRRANKADAANAQSSRYLQR